MQKALPPSLDSHFAIAQDLFRRGAVATAPTSEESATKIVRDFVKECTFASIYGAVYGPQQDPHSSMAAEIFGAQWRSAQQQNDTRLCARMRRLAKEYVCFAIYSGPIPTQQRVCVRPLALWERVKRLFRKTR